MTNRDRVLAILNKQKPDRVPWFGDLSYWLLYLEASGNLQEKYKGDGIYKYYRDLGVGFYLQCPFPFKTLHENVTIKSKKDGKMIITEIETPVGSLREVQKYLADSYTWAIEEHFVKDIRDLKSIRYFYDHTYYEADYKLLQDRYEQIGDNGIVMSFLPKSPLMELVALLAGIEATTFAILDDPDEFSETIGVLGRKADEAASISLKSPAECHMIPENLSSEVIGKNLFESYMRSYEQKWNSRIREAGKYSFVHMDGTMKGLIKEVSSTGFTVLEALTPSPVGDIPIDEINKYVNADTIIWGGLPGLYFTDLISDSEFDEFVIHVIEVMKTQPRYVLGVADQVPPLCRPERIKRVSELMEKHGWY
jgi:Uroporphyrinogen-III decarboxylase